MFISGGASEECAVFWGSWWNHGKTIVETCRDERSCGWQWRNNQKASVHLPQCHPACHRLLPNTRKVHHCMSDFWLLYFYPGSTLPGFLVWLDQGIGLCYSYIMYYLVRLASINTDLPFKSLILKLILADDFVFTDGFLPFLAVLISSSLVFKTFFKKIF